MARNDEAQAIIARRLASGEITPEQYDELRAKLGDARKSGKLSLEERRKSWKGLLLLAISCLPFALLIAFLIQPHSGQMTSDDFAKAFGGTLGGFAVALLISYFVSWRYRTASLITFVVLLGFSMYTHIDRERKLVNRDEIFERIAKDSRLPAIQLEHILAADKFISGRFGALNNPKLNEELQNDAAPDVLAGKRDAFNAAISDIDAYVVAFPKELPNALKTDDNHFKAKLIEIGATDDIADRMIELSDRTAVSPKTTDSINKKFALLKDRFAAGAKLMDFMAVNYVKIDHRDGKMLFSDDNLLKSFQTLAADAETKENIYDQYIGEKMKSMNEMGLVLPK